jgi:protein-S-isoprenylcysteine O-methyltransferase Ste14
MLRIAAVIVLSYLAWFVGPFVAAGTTSWPRAWMYFAVLAIGLVAHRTYVARRNPDLRRHRREIGTGTKRWDIAWNLVFWWLMASVPIVAGLDYGRAFTPMPDALWFVGFALFACAMSLSAWAMGVNPHFEGTVRIQTEREHRVVTRGPYAAVRHPGYVGLILWALATPFLLTSWSALAPAAVVVAWIVVRTVAEDELLRRELDGYEAYRRRVPARLVPGLF